MKENKIIENHSETTEIDSGIFGENGKNLKIHFYIKQNYSIYFMMS